MGQKVNPVGMRIGINRTWDSKWYASKRNYGKKLHEDLALQKMILNKLKDASVSRIEILRTANQVTINIHTAKPGLIIGRGGETIEAFRTELEKKFGSKFSVNIIEIKKPNLDAKIVAENVARQIERRISYRRAAKMAVEKSIEAGAIGVKILVGGRLNGVDIARSEFFAQGKVPLHTFRADIDYAYLPASTTYGAIGVKVWIYKGDIFKGSRREHELQKLAGTEEQPEAGIEAETPKEEMKEAEPKKEPAEKAKSVTKKKEAATKAKKNTIKTAKKK